MSASDAGPGAGSKRPGSTSTVHCYDMPLPLAEATALAAGEEWRCDVVGDATLTRDDGGTGCIATLRSSSAPGNTALKLVSRLAGRFARFGHDRLLDSGASQFMVRAVEPLVGVETALA